jgi:hypothetical protein
MKLKLNNSNVAVTYSEVTNHKKSIDVIPVSGYFVANEKLSVLWKFIHQWHRGR